MLVHTPKPGAHSALLSQERKGVTDVESNRGQAPSIHAFFTWRARQDYILPDRCNPKYSNRDIFPHETKYSPE